MLVDIGEQIAAARKKKGLRQKELARRCFVTPGAISGIETGRLCPSLETAARIAKVLELSLDGLVGIDLTGNPTALSIANRKMGRELHAALRDMKTLDACAVCGWCDENGVCHAPKDAQMGGGCFSWRGSKRNRFWEEL